LPNKNSVIKGRRGKGGGEKNQCMFVKKKNRKKKEETFGKQS